MRYGVSICLILVASISAFQKPVLAAPQILAVLATEGAIPVNCANGVCEAELSTYCLQRHRKAPERGATYRPASPDTFTLFVTAANGGIRRLQADQYLTFSQRRSYTAVLVQFPESVLTTFGGGKVSIEVRANASLVPEPQTNDESPLTAAEIENATGALRALGAGVVDNEGAHAGAARIVARLVNALPRDRRALGAERTAAWRWALAAHRNSRSAGQARHRARTAYDRCTGAIADHGAFSLRGCLEARHDELMRGLNDVYWNAGAGS